MDSLLRGIPVILLTASDTEARTWTGETVANVLVAPYAETDGTRVQQPQGHAAVYHMAIPKTDAHRWEGALVQFFGDTWAVVGVPTKGIDRLVPGPWNKKVVVELYRSGAPNPTDLWADRVQLLTVPTVKDADGYDVGSAEASAEVSAIFTVGIDVAHEADADKLGPRRSATVELWEGDYSEEPYVRYGSRLYHVMSCKQTGRGSVLLALEEVWR